MTDITKLAQREKFEAWWEREYKHLESSKYTDAVPHIKYGFWMAYQAGGAELVEALEKAQTENTAGVAGMAESYETTISMLKSRIAELEESNAQIIQSRDHYKRMTEEGLKQLAESRTVKLPEPFKLAKSSSGLTYYYADEVDAALTAHGIKVEAK
ncbi:hypothetical protein Q2T70_03980 [Klebsiella oxytoca]|uniref:hypothetical protein n=1 Tax=Klebsiella oxytoca TaxID=571 RepID=UPI00265DC05F|nr:hypothetical protein [Klebsiella oxytoca]WKM72917.1 hypothetical protein Q2T70_03980 [Klebsiella oxytoca]